MKVYQYYLNYRASRDNNPEWMGVAHTQDIQVRTAMSETLSVHLQQYTLQHNAWNPIIHTEYSFQWVFGHPFDTSRGYTEEEKHLSRDVMTWWTNFAKYG